MQKLNLKSLYNYKIVMESSDSDDCVIINIFDGKDKDGEPAIRKN